MALTEAVIMDWTPKGSSRKSAVRYQSRIVHTVQPIQPELAEALKTLKESAQDKFEFIKLGKLGVTLAELDPAVREIVGVDRKGAIFDQTRREVEDDLNDTFERFMGRVTGIADPERPFKLYGRQQNRLGIALDPLDDQLYGERIVAERYIRSEYPMVSDRFGDGVNTWEPHVTVAYVKPEQFTPTEWADLQYGPSEFLSALVFENAAMNRESYGLDNVPSKIMLPSELSLGGLQIVCNKQPERIF